MSGSLDPFFRPPPPIFFAALMLAAGVLLAIALVVGLMTYPAAMWTRVAGTSVERIVFAALLYLASHTLRAIRLVFILTDVRTSIRRLVEVHFLTAAVGMVIPFKVVGDLYRVIEIGALSNHYPRALIAVWIERAADSLMIGIIIVAALAFGPNTHGGVLPLLALLAIFIILSLIIFLVVPQNIGRLKHFVIRRYHSMAAVNFLRFIDLVQRTLSEAPRLLEQKYVTLLFLTACIWIAEALVLCAIIPGLLWAPGLLATGFGTLLAEIATGLSALGPLPVGAFEQISALGQLPAEVAAAIYRLATQPPLLVAGLAAFLHYGAYRLRQLRIATRAPHYLSPGTRP